MFYSERLPELGYSPEEIGLFFITPCPAKITEIKTVAQAGYHVDGAIPFLSIFGKLQEQLDSGEKIDVAPQSTGVGSAGPGRVAKASRLSGIIPCLLTVFTMWPPFWKRLKWIS